jgi:hypothetical protein
MGEIRFDIRVLWITSTFPERIMLANQGTTVLDFFLGKLHVVYMDRGGGHVSLRVVNVTWTDLEPLTFVLHF